MNIKLVKLLAMTCGILMVVIIAEWQYARYSKQQLFAKWVEEAERSYAPGELPQIELTLQAEDSFVELTSRPLFIEGRRPVPETDDDTGQIAVPVEKFDWELDGVYLHQDTSVALFSRSQRSTRLEKHLKKSEGEVIDGWTLLEIAPDKVVLEQDGKRHELMLRKPKPTKLPPQAKPPVRNSAVTAKPKIPFVKKDLQ